LSSEGCSLTRQDRPGCATEEGISVREIAETIGRHLNVPAVSIPAEQAADHF